MEYAYLIHGRPLVIVASGPTLTLAQIRIVAQARMRQRIRIMTVNDAVFVCPFVDWQHASDEPWWRAYDGLPNFPGFKSSISKTRYASVFTFENTDTTGYDPRPGMLRSGGLSGYQAIHIAAQCGVKQIALVGFDMAGGHFFGDHPANIPHPSPNWDHRHKDMLDLAEAIWPLGIEIVNCSPESRLRAWPKDDLERTIRRFEHA